MWLREVWTRVQSLMLPDPGHENRPPSCQGHHQMSGKTIAIPHRCERGVSRLCCTERPPRVLIRPLLTDARNIRCVNGARGRFVFLWFFLTQTTTRIPKYSCHCIHTLASMQAASGQSTWIYLQRWTRKRGEKACILELMFSVHGKNKRVATVCRAPWKLYGQGMDDAAKYPKELWILKDYVAHNLHPMPMFSSCAEHSVLFCSKAESQCSEGWVGGWMYSTLGGALMNQSFMWTFLFM